MNHTCLTKEESNAILKELIESSSLQHLVAAPHLFTAFSKLSGNSQKLSTLWRIRSHRFSNEDVLKAIRTLTSIGFSEAVDFISSHSISSISGVIFFRPEELNLKMDVEEAQRMIVRYAVIGVSTYNSL